MTQRQSAGRYPVEDGGGADLNKRLLDGDIQLAVNASTYAEFDAVDSVRLDHLQVQAIGHAAYLRRSSEAIDIAELCDKPLLILNKRHVSREMFDAACRLDGRSPVFAMESSSSHTLISTAAGGIDVAIEPSSARNGSNDIIL